MYLPVTDDIHLSEIRLSDKAAYLEHLQEKAISDCTLRIPFPYTKADADAWLTLAAQTTQLPCQSVNWAIRNGAGYLIGGIGFEDLTIRQSHRSEVGYWLAKPYWGRGIMTAVVSRACHFAFEEWGLAKINAHAFAFNFASAQVLEKCGFEQEGYLRKHFLKDGQFLDVKFYGLLN